MSENSIDYVKKTRTYYQTNLGFIPPSVEVLGKYNPEALHGFMSIRESIMKDPPSGALPNTFKEILFVVLDCTRSNAEGAEAHAKTFIKIGGTVSQLVEALILASYVTGLEVLVNIGSKAVKAAEAAAAEAESRGIAKGT
ncbi:MAG: carboxymuconolactone decarboxylase family protein [Nitrososphaerota archaeon]|jgi:hypothetical protein|nr:carboxymuconolactone decarboxylase family protein [Nitrososphaerota archaeon]MDG6923630.1 carboxymuconolactone decarboxylase family protein [Nitrososphaerota archaeon]